MNGAYKTELIYNPNKGGPWKTLEQLETATAEWVWRHNNKKHYRVQRLAHANRDRGDVVQ
jgi:hypothetical protein